jgi:membrane associated rhomboid family serine protease
VAAGKDALMFVPLHDDTPLRVIRFQFVTIAIIIANVVIFLFTGALVPEGVTAAVATGFGIIPVELTMPGLDLIPYYDPIPLPFTYVTYMFVHGSWVHLLSNMLFLWVFADNIEDAFGYAGFAIFYVICGAAAGLTHAIMEPASTAPLIGASGAVSGIIGAYLLLYPRARIWMLIFIPIPIRISAYWVLGVWFLLQMYNLVMAQQTGMMEVAWWAHIGGFATGLALTFLLRSRLLVRS